jgi:hypothetical protein
MKKYLVFLLLLLSQIASAQQLLPPIELFSSKTESYILMKNGDSVVYFHAKVRYEKRGIVGVVGKKADGTKAEYKAEDIKVLAMPPSDFGKFASFGDANRSLAKSKKTNQKAYKRDLVYFFSEQVEGRSVLLQLLNPDFDNKIKIYHDPFAGQTTGWGIGGVTMVGGEDKSYYLKVNDKTTKIQKKEYKEKFKQLFGSCSKLLEKYKEPNWDDFAAHVFFFENECN